MLNGILSGTTSSGLALLRACRAGKAKTSGQNRYAQPERHGRSALETRIIAPLRAARQEPEAGARALYETADPT
jgi:hypothetical protein